MNGRENAILGRQPPSDNRFDGRVGLSILHVFAPGPFAGAERSVLSAVHALKSFGHAAEFLIIKELRKPANANSFAALAKELSIPVVVIPTTRRFDMTLSRRLSAFIATGGYDIVHCHGYKTLIHLTMARNPNSTPPLIVTYHGFTSHDLTAMAYEWLEWLAYQRVDCLFAVSENSMEFLSRRGMMRCKTAVVPNMVTPLIAKTPIEKPHKGRKVTLLFLGRLSREKGLDVLLEALHLRVFSHLKLTVVGEGPERHSLEETMRTYGLENQVYFEGFKQDIKPYLEEADALVMPSRTEGMPMALLEAAVSGIPVIATKVGGIPEIVIHNQNGLLVTPENPAQLADAIENMVKELERIKLGAASAAPGILSKYGPDKWVDRALTVYRETIKTASESRGASRC
jgi:glycosyltransferase involved in cell wall biosynthesis